MEVIDNVKNEFSKSISWMIPDILTRTGIEINEKIVISDSENEGDDEEDNFGAFLLEIDNWLYVFLIYEIAFLDGRIVMDWSLQKLDEKTLMFNFETANIIFIDLVEEDGKCKRDSEANEKKYFYLFYGNEADMLKGSYRALRFNSEDEMIEHGEYLDSKGWRHCIGGYTDCKWCEELPLYRRNGRKSTKPFILGPDERLFYLIDYDKEYRDEELIKEFARQREENEKTNKEQ